MAAPAAENPNVRRYNDQVSDLPHYFGSAKDTMSAQTLIDRVETAKGALGWSEVQAYQFFKNTLQENAQDWVKMIKLIDPGYTATWAWISTQFKKHYGDTIDETKVYLMCKDLAMKTDENPRDFMIRFAKSWGQITDILTPGAIVVPAVEAERTVDYCTDLYAKGRMDALTGMQKLFYVSGLPHKLLTAVVQKKPPTTLAAFNEAVTIHALKQDPAKNGKTGVHAVQNEEEDETDEQFVNQIRNGSNRGRGFNGRGRSLSRGGRGGPAGRGRGGSAGPAAQPPNPNAGPGYQYGNGNGNQNSFEPKPKCKYCNIEGHNQEKCYKRIAANAPCVNKNGAKYWPNSRQQAPIKEEREAGEENQLGAVYNRSENLFQ
jgi:hypothetical protein